MEVDGIPFTSISRYYHNGAETICHCLKEGDKNVTAYAALKMSDVIPRNAVLIPVPNRCGYARQTLQLAQLISKYTGLPVADVLKGNQRESQYYAKKEDHPLTEQGMGFRRVGEYSRYRKPIIIDGVADLGTTARAAIHALGEGEVVTYAVTDNLLAQGRQMHRTCGMHR